jgi:hypothetical protein
VKAVWRTLEVAAVAVVIAGLIDAAFEPTMPRWLALAVPLLLGVGLFVLFVKAVRMVRLGARAIRGDAKAAWTDLQFPQGPEPSVVPVSTPAGWQVSLRPGEQWYWDGSRYTGDRPNPVGWHLNAREGQEWYWDGSRYLKKRPLKEGWHTFPYAGVDVYWDGAWGAARPILDWRPPQEPPPEWSTYRDVRRTP